jgi:hypothetical protein
VLIKAGVAGLVTAVLCYPRLALWMERPRALPLLVSTMLWCTCVLWGFVFAWHERYSGKRIFPAGFDVKTWAGATAAGLLWSALLYWVVDPQLRPITPEDYAADWNALAAKTLFRLSFEPLFFCFAPFAFFIRLMRKPERAVAMTIIFGLFVLYLRLTQSKTVPPFYLMVELVAMLAVTRFVSLYFYIKGGAPAVWWLTLLSQARLMFELGN